MIGPWTLGDNSHERYPHVWYRLDILNSAPMSAFDVVAEVWPRGASGYGWAVTLPGGRKVEGDSRDTLASDEENLRRCKAAADKVVATNYATTGTPAKVESGTLPDVRHMPLADRRAVFLDGLRALTQMTGVAAALNDSGDPYVPEPIVLQDTAALPGAYAFDGYELTWRVECEHVSGGGRRRRRKT